MKTIKPLWLTQPIPYFGEESSCQLPVTSKEAEKLKSYPINLLTKKAHIVK
jgi:hypothetical protein